MFDQTIFVVGILPPANQFGTSTILPGPITRQIQSIPSAEAFGNHSIGNITLNSSIDTQEYFGYPKVTALSPEAVVTPLLPSQFPAFVREDHERFLEFMEAYYEWMESHGQALLESKRLLKNQDIDTTVDKFVEYFRKEFLVNIPTQIQAPKDLVLKNIKEYYRARGTEKSFRFFFRILLGLDASFYYPRVDILRVSDGKWIQHKTLRVTITQGNGFDLVGRKIRGLTNNSSAFVENVQFVQEGFISVYEIYLNRSSITGVFEQEEEIRSSDGDIIGLISPIPISVNITNPGLGYELGQNVVINGTGSGALAKITSIGPNGEVQKVEIKNYGAAYFETPTPPTAFFPVYSGVTLQATGTVTVGALTNYPGYYLNEDGQLSTTKFLQDSYYYQQFSYVVQVDEAVVNYRDALKKALHPAGLIFFGTVLSQNAVDGSVKVPTSRGQNGTTLLRIIQQMTCKFVEGIKRDWSGQRVREDLASNRPQDLSDDQNMLIEENVGYNKLYPNLVGKCPLQAKVSCSSEVKIIHWFKEAPQTFKLGPSFRSIQRDKFTYKPRERYDANQDMSGGNNSSYWSGPIYPYANYQIKDFGHIIIKDMNEKPWTKINILPEPVLRNSDLTGIQSEEEIGTPTIIQS